MTELINGLYCEGARLGQGAFGQIFLGQNVQTKQYVAIKKELSNCKSPQLKYESNVYKCLEGGMGIPKVYFQKNDVKENIMVMDLLGPSLEDMFNYCYRKFTLKTVLMLGIELLTRLEFIHHRNFIHRDIKPDNFVLGLGNRANVIYVIDFGLSKRYRTPGTKEHIPYRENRSLTGTPRYASINNHMGIEQSRRDDLESLGYVLIYFLKGRLPWQGLAGNAKKQKYEMIMRCKMNTSLDQLCEGLPAQFKDYMIYCRNLQFDQVPEYRHLRRLFKCALEERGWKNDGVYDWVNNSTKYNNAKLPKHCLTSSGVMLNELRKPADAEFREMYKEEAYRQKQTVTQQSLKMRPPTYEHMPPQLSAAPRRQFVPMPPPVVMNSMARRPYGNYGNYQVHSMSADSPQYTPLSRNVAISASPRYDMNKPVEPHPPTNIPYHPNLSPRLAPRPTPIMSPRYITPSLRMPGEQLPEPVARSPYRSEN